MSFNCTGPLICSFFFQNICATVLCDLFVDWIHGCRTMVLKRVNYKVIWGFLTAQSVDASFLCCLEASHPLAERFLERKMLMNLVTKQQCLHTHLPLRGDVVPVCSLSCVQLMDCSLPGSTVHGIFQAKILEWVAISFSRGSSPPRDRTCTSCGLLHWQAGSLPAEPPGKPPQRWYKDSKNMVLKFKRLTVSSVDSDVEQLELSYTVDRRINGYNPFGKLFDNTR